MGNEATLSSTPVVKFLSIPEDRGFTVPPDEIVYTEYVTIESVVLDCTAPMALGDVQRAMDRLRAAQPGQPFPCPYGYRSPRGRFHIQDGRHAYVAALMLGYTHLLVAHI